MSNINKEISKFSRFAKNSEARDKIKIRIEEVNMLSPGEYLCVLTNDDLQYSPKSDCKFSDFNNDTVIARFLLTKRGICKCNLEDKSAYPAGSLKLISAKQFNSRVKRCENARNA